MIKLINSLIIIIKMILQFFHVHIFFVKYRYEGAQYLHLDLLNKSKIIEQKQAPGVFQELANNPYIFYSLLIIGTIIIIGGAILLLSRNVETAVPNSSQADIMSSSDTFTPNLADPVQAAINRSFDPISNAEIFNEFWIYKVNKCLSATADSVCKPYISPPSNSNEFLVSFIKDFTENQDHLAFIYKKFEFLIDSGLKVDPGFVEYVLLSFSEMSKYFANNGVEINEAWAPIAVTSVLINCCFYITYAANMSVITYIKIFKPIYAVGKFFVFCKEDQWFSILMQSFRDVMSLYESADSISQDKNFLDNYNKMLDFLKDTA